MQGLTELPKAPGKGQREAIRSGPAGGKSPSPSHVQAGMWRAMWGRLCVLLAVVVTAAQGWGH